MRVRAHRRIAWLLLALSTALLVSTSVLVYLAQPVQAAQTIPYMINFQGRLTDNNGNILPDGSYNIKFRIFDALTSGTNKWEGDRVFGASDHRVQLSNGLFNTQFGDTTQGDPALSPSLFSGTYPLYLEVELPTPATATCNTNGCASFTEGAMTPRQALASAPYAFNSDTLDGLDSSAFGQLAQNNQTWTGANLFAPTSASTVALTVKATTAGSTNGLEVFDSSGVRQSYFDSGGAFTTLKQITAPTSTNTINGLVINSGSLTSVGPNITASAGLTIASTGSNYLSLDTGGAATINLGGTNATQIALKVVNGANNTTLQFASPSATGKTLTLPNETGTVCTNAATGACTASGGFVQLQAATPGTQQSGNFNISGTGIAGTLLAGYTGITGGVAAFNGNVGVGTSSPGAILHVSASGSTDLFKVTDTTATAQDVLKIASHGATTLRNQTDSTGAFQIQSAVSGTAVLTADTTNSQLIVRGINSVASIGSNLVTSQDFTSANWSTCNGGAGGWSGTATTATHNAGNVTACSATTSNLTVTFGATYQVSFTLAGNTTATNTVQVSIGSATAYALGQTGSNTQTVVLTTTSTSALTFTPSVNFNGAISNISVQLVALANNVFALQNSNGSTGLEVRSGGAGLGSTFVGLNSGRSNSSGLLNTGLGYGALQSNTTGNVNTAVGYGALQNNTTGQQNVAIGYGALAANTTGSNNIALGSNTLNNVTTGTQNTAVGYGALEANVTGSSNTALGYQAAYQDPNVTAFATLPNLQNTVTIGYGAQVQASNSLILGGQGTLQANVGIGTTSPTNLFSVSPDQYDIGTANVTGGVAAVTNGTGATPTWTTAMVGSELIFADGTKYTISAVPGTTSITLSTNATTTETNAAYRIHLPALQVTSAGNVGIGTTSPSYSLDVNGNGRFQGSNLYIAGASGAPALKSLVIGDPTYVPAAGGRGVQIQDATSAALSLKGGSIEGDFSTWGTDPNGASMMFNMRSNADISFLTNNTERMRIKNGGSVGIGTSNPSALFSVGSSSQLQVDGSGNITTSGTYNSNTLTSSALTFGAASAATVQSASGQNLNLTAQGTGNLNLTGTKVQIGSGTTDTTQINLQLDSNSNFADTGTCGATTNQGALYYNTNTNAVRGCVNGAWEDVVTTAGLGAILYGVVPDSGSNPGDLPALGTAAVTGPCKVSASTSSTTQVVVQPCIAYSGGRKVVVANATTLTLNGMSGTNLWQHVCFNSTGVPALTAASTEAAGFPAWSINNPLLCIADVKGTTSSNVITAVYDTRVFTTSQKEFVTSAAALAMGQLAVASGNGVATAAATAGLSVRGVVVASSGAASAGNAPSGIIATSGPAFVKATAGTAGQLLQSGATTAGYAVTVAVPVATAVACTTVSCTAGASSTFAANPYAYVGYARVAFPSTACTAGVAASPVNCDRSLYTDIALR